MRVPRAEAESWAEGSLASHPLQAEQLQTHQLDKIVHILIKVLVLCIFFLEWLGLIWWRWGRNQSVSKPESAPSLNGGHEEEGCGGRRKCLLQPPHPAQSTLWPRKKEGLTVIQAPTFRDCVSRHSATRVYTGNHGGLFLFGSCLPTGRITYTHIYYMYMYVVV